MVKRSLLFFSLALVTMALYSQDLKLWYRQPANKWTEALPIGNGRLGAMVFGGVETERLQFNEETLWTGGPRDYNRKGAYRYLDTLRQLLFAGKQREAEMLAEEQFMGLKSADGDRAAWIKKIQSLSGLKDNPSKLNFNDKEWKEMQVPSYEGWEAIGYDGLDGAVWLRTSFDIPAGWEGKELVLDLNRIRDQDFTYINGKLVGSMATGDARRYTVPGKILVTGKNSIAVLVLNFYDKGGISGYKDTTRHIGIYPKGEEDQKISLVKKWKYFVQDNEPPAVARYQADYQPFGDILINFKGIQNPVNYRRELDLSNAVARTSFSANGITYTREYLSSAPAQVIAVHLTASAKGSVSFEAMLQSPHSLSSVKQVDGNTLALSVKVRHGELRGESLLKVLHKNGRLQVKNGKLIVTGADEATLLLTATTNYKNYKDVSSDPVALSKAAMSRLRSKEYQTIRAAHISDYQNYFNTFSLHFEGNEQSHLPTDERLKKFASSHDPSFVALYAQYGRYLLLASSRPGTRPANLQGIWNDLLTPPWGSKYTTNINAEMNYWPAEILNLSPLHEPLLTMIKELSEAGAATAKAYYNAPGWVLHHNTDLWRGTAPINASNHGIWVTGGAWLSHHLWEHYLFTGDKKFLAEKGYPIMKGAARFFNHFLVKDPKTGWLISTPSNSPEHGGLVAGPSMDHQIIRSLFKAVMQASEILGKDPLLRDSLSNKLAQIAPDQIGRHGQLQEWLQDMDDPKNNHRHVSHLWAVYPGAEITWDKNDSLMKAARQSLLYRGDAATGWSLGWKINLWARFKDGEHTYKLVKMLLSPAEKGGAGSYANLFDAHPPFQIDGNFGGAAGIGEMLVQSHTGYIDLLPALPAALGTGDVKGIRARGGFELALRWKDGNLQGGEVLSLNGNECRLRYKGKVVSFPTQKGKTYNLNREIAWMK